MWEVGVLGTSFDAFVEASDTVLTGTVVLTSVQPVVSLIVHFAVVVTSTSGLSSDHALVGVDGDEARVVSSSSSLGACTGTASQLGAQVAAFSTVLQGPAVVGSTA